MFKRINLSVFIVMALCIMLAAPAWSAPLPGNAGLLPSTGKFIVEVQKDGNWIEAAVIGANRHMNEMHADISEVIKGMKIVTVRVKAIGGGLAHMDSITLGGMAPLNIKGNIDPANKLLKRDLDVIDVTGKSVTASFKSSSDGLLVVSGRIEPDVIGKTPFNFPKDNMYQEVKADSKFYTYTLNGTKKSKPFFKEMSYSGSGHPDGYTYGWVTNDKDNLYVGIDFTGDNTMDGELDYAKVFAKTKSGVKEYKITAKENTWGDAFFTYTDKVAYQHKVYQFTIPMDEVVKNKDGRIELAFAAYGTDTPAVGAQHSPTSAYDPVSQRHFVVFREYQGADPDWSQRDVVGRFYDTVGQPVGSDILISNNADDYNDTPAQVAYDSNNNSFLVVWRDETSTDIYGQFVDASTGSLLFNTVGENLLISNATGNKYEPDVSYDSAGDRFLVVWEDSRNPGGDIYGQFVNSLDGSLLFNTVGENFPISNATNSQYAPDVSYDSTGDRFMVVWEDYRSGGSGDIYGQFVDASDGSLVFNTVGENFPISNATDSQANPSVSYDSTGDRFLVAWYDSRNAGDNIYGQLIDATDGSLLVSTVNTNIAISTNSAQQFQPAVASTGYGAYLVIWEDRRNASLRQIYGQAIDASDASLIDTAAATNLFILNTTDSVYRPALSHDPDNDRFLVSAHWEDGAGPDNRGIVAIVYPEYVAPEGGEDSGSSGGGGCFIATAAYGSYSDSHVMALRQFRDEVLFKSEFGTALVDMYYAYSPPVADFIAKHPALRLATRTALAPVVYTVKYPVMMGLVFAGMGGGLIGLRRRRKQ